MKLLSYTSRIQLRYFLVLFVAFSVLFFFLLKWSVLQNVDEILYNRKSKLVDFYEKNPGIPIENHNNPDDYKFSEVSESTFMKSTESYIDTLIYEPVDDEMDEYRKLTSFLEINNRYYKLEIVGPHLETPDLIITIGFTLGLLFLGLALAFYLSHRIISRKIWSPFYATLESLRQFRLDKQQMPELNHFEIEEFRLLNESIYELAKKNLEVFQSQKQFIEDASHEMQTPLSIIQSRLETLIGQDEITSEQADIIEGIINSTQRLKKLSKTLLLLSKIENKQFLLSEQVDINRIVNQAIEYYEEQKDALNISLKLELIDTIIVRGNTMLSEILIQNLMKNAFLHNIENGNVQVSIEQNKLIISNSGISRTEESSILEKPNLFNRFYKQSVNPDSLGLGLAIAKKITDTSGWRLQYHKKNDMYIFEIDFG